MIATFCVLALVVSDRGQELVAESRAKLLDTAVKKYYLEHGEFPSALPMLADYLEEGKKGLSSHWGIPYQYTLGEEKLKDGSIGVTAHIWTERMVDKQILIYGKKPPEKK